MKKTCQYCGDIFTPKRSTKKFCSNSCRVLYSIHQCSKSERFVGDTKIANHMRDYQLFITGKPPKNLTIRQWFGRVCGELEGESICKKNTTPPFRRELLMALEMVSKTLGESYYPYIV